MFIQQNLSIEIIISIPSAGHGTTQAHSAVQVSTIYPDTYSKQIHCFGACDIIYHVSQLLWLRQETFRTDFEKVLSAILFILIRQFILYRS
mmetsp:Transcript_20127/g.33088  ORF Transcript_20127/g.33088 Transcript_20127/m.33088 type:complete len:91 (-) Transcript_20127:223-495(-)